MAEIKTILYSFVTRHTWQIRKTMVDCKQVIVIVYPRVKFARKHIVSDNQPTGCNLLIQNKVIETVLPVLKEDYSRLAMSPKIRRLS